MTEFMTTTEIVDFLTDKLTRRKAFTSACIQKLSENLPMKIDRRVKKGTTQPKSGQLRMFLESPDAARQAALDSVTATISQFLQIQAVEEAATFAVIDILNRGKDSSYPVGLLFRWNLDAVYWLETLRREVIQDDREADSEDAVEESGKQAG